MEGTQQLRNLIMMAVADGKLDDSELAFLAERCHNFGLSGDDFQSLFTEATRDDATLELPSEYRDKMTLLRDLLRLMAADGKLLETEKRLFAHAAVRMGISPTEIDEVINQLLIESTHD